MSAKVSTRSSTRWPTPSTDPVRIAFLDTSVLFPVSLLDLGLRLVERSLHDIRWSDEVLEELERVWDRERRSGRRVPSPGAARAALAGIRRTFPDQRVPTADFAHLVATMPGTDPDDRPHAATALSGGATHLVTADTAGGFPREELAVLGLRVASPDEYYSGIAADYPEDVRRVVELMAARRAERVSGFTASDLLDRFEQLELHELVAALR
jgi:predicted nucleic acid-binding protein